MTRNRCFLVDWLRSTHGDSRYGMALAKLEVSYPFVSLDHIDAESFDRWTPVVEDPDPDSLGDAMIDLGQGLSEDACWALANVASWMALGANQTAALQASRNRISYGEARRRLEVLREELAHRGD